ncbi:MAG: hypothetical protein ACYCO3_16215, partial [Mycobacteriales bacterium]
MGPMNFLTGGRSLARLALLVAVLLTLAACGGARPAAPRRPQAVTRVVPTPSTPRPSGPARAAASPLTSQASLNPKASAKTSSIAPLPAPLALAPFPGTSAPGQGAWHPAGRPVGGISAVYET